MFATDQKELSRVSYTVAEPAEHIPLLYFIGVFSNALSDPQKNPGKYPKIVDNLFEPLNPFALLPTITPLSGVAHKKQPKSQVVNCDFILRLKCPWRRRTQKQKRANVKFTKFHDQIVSMESAISLAVAVAYITAAPRPRNEMRCAA